MDGVNDGNKIEYIQMKLNIEWTAKLRREKKTRTASISRELEKDKKKDQAEVIETQNKNDSEEFMHKEGAYNRKRSEQFEQRNGWSRARFHRQRTTSPTTMTWTSKTVLILLSIWCLMAFDSFGFWYSLIFFTVSLI